MSYNDIKPPQNNGILVNIYEAIDSTLSTFLKSPEQRNFCWNCNILVIFSFKFFSINSLYDLKIKLISLELLKKNNNGIYNIMAWALLPVKEIGGMCTGCRVEL